MKKYLLLIVGCCLLMLLVSSQPRFSARCFPVNKNNYQIEVRGQLEKGWRVYTAGDTAFNLVPLAVTWADVSIVRFGASSISNKHIIKDVLFNNKSLEVVDHDFELTQSVIIKGAAPAALLIKITGFAASKDQFIPIDTTLQVAMNAAAKNETNENDLLLPSVDLDNPVSHCGTLVSNATSKNDLNNDWLIFLKGFAGGLLAMLMPCIFPIIPVTISVFTGKSNGLRNSLFYGLSIVVIYTLASLPFHVIGGLNPQILNELSTNATVNLVFFFIFVAFALSLFGVFEIRLPAAFGNKAGNKSDAGSFVLFLFPAPGRYLVFSSQVPSRMAHGR